MGDDADDGRADAGRALRRMAGLATPMALRVAVTLGLPDRLRDAPVGTTALAGELGVPAAGLELLLAHLVTLDVLERGPGGYRTTEFGGHLTADADGGFTHLLLDLDSAAGRAELAFTELLHSVRTGEPGYVRRYGRDFWSDAAAHPELRASFDRQMSLRLAGQFPRLAAGYDWSRFGTVLDVGGGPGDLLAAILAAHPDVRGHLLDLPPTAEAARRTFAERGLTGRTDVTARSFFDPLPPGADAYLLSDILHDWDDAHVHRILARCAEAVPRSGRVVVVELVSGRYAATDVDLSMFVMYGGRERSVDVFRALAAEHGLTLDGVTDVSHTRTILEFRPT